MFLDHRPNRPVRHLAWRLRLFAGGAVFAMLGIFLDSRWMVWVAIGFLLVGFLIRLLPGGESSSDSSEGPPSEG